MMPLSEATGPRGGGGGGGGVLGLEKGTDCGPTPVAPLSDYLGTHQCSKNAKLGGF